MSRSGYSDDCDGWELICWRGAVASAIRGRRGQAFLCEMLEALDALPKRQLIVGEIEAGGDVCALGALAVRRALPGLLDVDPYNRPALSSAFGIAPALAAEIMWVNDEAGYYGETPEGRWLRVREWVVSGIKDSMKAAEILE